MNIGTIIIAILVFGLLIFVHELGHFLSCRISGVTVNEFALGMGPAIWQTTRGDTLYSLRLIPMGGYCAMEGEDEDNWVPGSFNSAPLSRRILIITAGSIMNLLLGFLILTGFTVQQPALGSTVVADFMEGAVSDSVLQTGDRIIKVDGRRVRTNHDLTYAFSRNRDGVMDILVEREGQRLLLPNVTFQIYDLGDGIEAVYKDFRVYGMEKTVLGVVHHSFNLTGSYVRQVWGTVIDLFTGRYSMKVLSGPVGVTAAIGEASSMGLGGLMNIVAFITINLGVFNMLPLPALDGGRLVFLIIEGIRRRPVPPRYERLVHAIGFMLLISLVLYATFNDVGRLL